MSSHGRRHLHPCFVFCSWMLFAIAGDADESDRGCETCCSRRKRTPGRRCFLACCTRRETTTERTICCGCHSVSSCVEMKRGGRRRGKGPIVELRFLLLGFPVTADFRRGCSGCVFPTSATRFPPSSIDDFLHQLHRRFSSPARKSFTDRVSDHLRFPLNDLHPPSELPFHGVTQPASSVDTLHDDVDLDDQTPRRPWRRRPIAIREQRWYVSHLMLFRIHSIFRIGVQICAVSINTSRFVLIC
ncbi:hypothetical protein LXL04_007914 [Taraxacum kok-saghyz]